ncbi:hypothetical protein EC991_000936 [Linnemannia zychae]|nr:hypothetical protein EC991_000936 [Linnemannia zychae]
MEYEPKRIAHYPDHIIDVVCVGPIAAPSPGVSLSFPSAQLLPTDHIEQMVSSLALQPSNPSASSTYYLSSMARPIKALLSIDSSIANVQQQLDRSTDQQSVHHQQLLQQLYHMIEQQNEMLREQAASKKREEEMLREQAEAKLRDEQMLKMQQEAIDRLIVAQKKVDALLVQNYELHEYPIPRLFVILPDSYETWDPRNFFVERFRLYFLCECNDQCSTDAGITEPSGQLTIAAATLGTPVPVKNSVHLAKHEGYELSRPTEFFDRYGPYILGMLQILKHCLSVATVVAPAVGLAETKVKDVMDGVKSISERTLEAVKISIDYLEQKVDENTAADGVARVNSTTQDDDMFKGLAALEGADLRRMDTFLRNSDKDKILGNLYRITTSTGHVKWVCLEHYRQVYRETAMASFLESVETNGGTYDPQLGKVTIALKSSIAAKDFFSRLSIQAQAVTTLRVTLDWSFGSSDLAKLVDSVSQSGIQSLELDLKDDFSANPTVASLRPGKGRYHSLLNLLSNTKVRGLTFFNVALIGSRTSSIPTNHQPSLLQSFHFIGVINAADDSRLADIISHCPGLVDLRLGSLETPSHGIPKIDQVIGSLSKLESLHRYQLYTTQLPADKIRSDATPYGNVALRELVDYCLPYGAIDLLEAAIRRSAESLELLALNCDFTGHVFNMDRVFPSALASVQPLSKLKYLALTLDLNYSSIRLLKSILPGLLLSHFEADERTSLLLPHIDLSSLKSITLTRLTVKNFDQFSNRVFWEPSCQINALTLGFMSEPLRDVGVLCQLPLKRLHLYQMGSDNLIRILQNIYLPMLETLIIVDGGYTWEVEAFLAARSSDFSSGFVVQLPILDTKSNIYTLTSRAVQGSSTRLLQKHVRLMDGFAYEQEFVTYRFPCAWR